MSWRDYGAFMQASPVAIIVVGLDGLVLAWSVAAERMFGWTEAETLGRHCPNVPPEAKAQYQQHFDRVLAGASLVGEEVLRCRKDGTRLDVSLSTAPQRDDAGRMTAILSASVDISEHKRISEALRASETRFRALIENAPDLVVIIDAAGVIQYQSPTSIRLFGNLRGQPMFTRVIPEDAQRVQAAFAGALANPGKTVSIEAHAIDVEDGVRILDASIANRLAEPGVQGIVINARDITDRRATETQLRHSQRLETVAQLTAGIAHDFNNVLSVILSSAELIAANVPPGEGDIRADADNIRAAALNGTALIHRLMTYTRQMELTVASRDLGQVVREVAEMLRRILPRQVTLALDIGDSPKPSLIDAGAVQQVILNLATNARDAMPGGGTLSVSLFTMELDPATAARYHWLAPGIFHGVRVADTGTGMTPAVRERVFEPFFTTKEPGKGTGLGMPMVYAIMQQHGGFVDLASAVNRGTVVSIHFPAAEPVEEVVAERPEVRRGEGQRILLVEDEDALRRAALRILERGGYQARVAKDGQEALEMIEADPAIDLIISDVQMPRLDGLGLQDAVRRRGLRVPFLFLSGNPMQELFTRATQDGRTTFLQKPWTVDNMRRAVLDALAGDAGPVR